MSIDVVEVTAEEKRQKELDRIGRLAFYKGYTWLEKRTHPLLKGGYMPKCPFFPMRVKDRKFSFQAREIYKQKWVEGFNQRIIDKELKVPNMVWV